MLAKKNSVILLMVCLSAALNAQTSLFYNVSNSSPFTIIKNGNKFDPPHSQKATSEKTNFIKLDRNLNIYSYAEIPSVGINIYKNGELIKKFPMKVTGLIVLNADSLGNWSAYTKTVNAVSSIYTNGKLIKTVKIDETVSEKIVGIEYNGDVFSLVTDKIKSQLALKKNGNVISSKTFPKLNGVAEAIRVIGKDAQVSSYILAYWVNPGTGMGGSTTPHTGTGRTTTLCGEGSSVNMLCLEAHACLSADGTINFACAQEQVSSGVCPCTKSSPGSSTIANVPVDDSGSGIKN